MTLATIPELYDLYLNTLTLCSTNTRRRPDDELLCFLFEDFDVQARAYLHEVCLTQLHAAGLLDDYAVKQSDEIRRMWFPLEKRDWTTSEIRCHAEWDEIFARCDSLLTYVTNRNLERQGEGPG